MPCQILLCCLLLHSDRFTSRRFRVQECGRPAEERRVDSFATHEGPSTQDACDREGILPSVSFAFRCLRVLNAPSGHVCQRRPQRRGNHPTTMICLLRPSLKSSENRWDGRLTHIAIRVARLLSLVRALAAFGSDPRLEIWHGCPRSCACTAAAAGVEESSSFLRDLRFHALVVYSASARPPCLPRSFARHSSNLTP